MSQPKAVPTSNIVTCYGRKFQFQYSADGTFPPLTKPLPNAVVPEHDGPGAFRWIDISTDMDPSNSPLPNDV